ncbi:MAG: hypothetical protein JO027_02980 [Solirubrobacterales bacterium]|nr:hypothetical protein [Solirubrobacterales bacterium]
MGCALVVCAWASAAQADAWHHGHRGAELRPGDLLVSTSDYVPADVTAGVTQLPPGCATAPTGSCATAVVSGDDFPAVFNNDSVDSFFGVDTPVYLDELTPWGEHVGTIRVPTNEFVTSFSSKSELALNLSPEGRYVSFMGYDAQPGVVDSSNANTPGVLDPGNGDVGPYYRVVAQLDRWGHFTFTRTNAYSGDNGRAAITNDENGQDLVYTAGNAGQSGSPPANVVQSAGAQFVTPSQQPEADQTPGAPTPLGSFNITELGYPLDKATKDNNFRAIAIHDNVIYYTKGSGGNGINTVYFVDTTGKACPNGVGLPVPGAQLPTSPPTFTVENFGTAKKPNNGLVPTNMCILKGFPTNLAKSTTNFPFGMWFANDHTLYVADEGAGDNTFANGQYVNATAAAQPNAGLEKWVFDATAQQWKLAYTLQNGLDLGQPYTVPGYPTGLNTGPGGTMGPWSPATDGLRALTGRVGPDGIATIWAVTSTVSGSGDNGADPDKLVATVDAVNAAAPAPWERFWTVRDARFGQVLRGVSFTPGTESDRW